MIFWKLLNKTETKHLHSVGIRTVAGFKSLRTYQLELEETRKNIGQLSTECCYDCRAIAKKVGLS